MHDYSLPPGDRLGPPDSAPPPKSVAPATERPGFAVMIAGHGYYRKWRRGRGPLTTLQIRRARVYTAQQTVESEVARLRRCGLRCSVVPLVIKIGSD